MPYEIKSYAAFYLLIAPTESLNAVVGQGTTPQNTIPALMQYILNCQ